MVNCQANIMINLILLTIFFLPSVTSIASPPKIDVPEKKDVQILFKDQEYELFCEARGDPAPTYTWKLNNEEIPADSNIEVDSTTGHLTISEMTYMEEGDYQCFATNTISGKEAVAMSPVVTLLIAEFDAQWEDSDEGDETYKEGVYVKLPCENQPKSVPKPQYSWYLAEGEETRGEVKSDDRKYVDGEGTLHFMYILKADANLQLRYKCGLFNSKLDTIRLGSQKNVLVESDEKGLQQIGAKFEFSTPGPTAVITKNAELECVFSGYPIPQVKWFKNETPLKNGDKYEFPEGTFGRKLVIHNVDEKDETTYYCQGFNEKSETEKKAMFLDVTSGPIWVKSLSSLTEVEGRDAVFTCKARPAVGDKDLNEPQWFQNGDLLPAENTGKFEFSDSKQVLTVKNINKDTDITCFQCNVSNDRGYEFADGCLNIIEPIVVTSQPALEQSVAKGDLVNLTVTATTDPDMTLEYRWKYNNVTYINNDLPPFVVFNATSFEAYINTSDLTEEEFLTINGTYYRVFYHQYEIKTVPITVELHIPEIIAPVAAAGASLWWIPILVALLVIIILVIIIACVVCYTRERGTYPLDKKERASHNDPEKELAAGGLHDLSRAHDDDTYPSIKSPLVNPNFYDDDDGEKPEGDDESLEAYANNEQAMRDFSEDGSFIGQYASKKQKPEVA